MVSNVYSSQCKPQVNARILRAIEEIVCRYRNSLANGWRVIVKFQRRDEEEPYYHLDLESNRGGGDYAPTKMQMLENFPNMAATGPDSIGGLKRRIMLLRQGDKIPEEVAEHTLNMLGQCTNLTDLPESEWEILKKYGLTRWHGGIRIPYDILLTNHQDDPHGTIERRLGEIRIAFSGAKEWQDVYFALLLFQNIQTILNELWDMDQIWYNLRELRDDTIAGFWLNNLEIAEAPQK